MGILSRGTTDVVVGDAILTDLGRQRIAQSSASTVDFDIVQYSVSDDDIDYSVFDPENRPAGATFEDLVARITRRNLVFEPATAGSTQGKYKMLRVPLNQLSTITTLPTLRVSPSLDPSISLNESLNLTVSQEFRGDNIQPSLIDDSFFIQFNPVLIRLTSADGQSSSSDITVDAFRVATTRFIATSINEDSGSTLNMTVNTVFNNFTATANQFGVSNNEIRTAITVIGKNTGISRTIVLTITD
jgi:hypothetical protein